MITFTKFQDETPQVLTENTTKTPNPTKPKTTKAPAKKTTRSATPKGKNGELPRHPKDYRFEVGDLLVVGVKTAKEINGVDFTVPHKVVSTRISTAVTDLQIIYFEGMDDFFPATDFKKYEKT